MEKNLEKRMYFFVPYQLTGIQQAIQAGHAALEYARKEGDSAIFQDFVDNHKTWIILNGGTTNSKRDFSGIAKGSLNQIGDLLLENKIKFAYFKEPDLEDALTAICFICDERVWNYEDYPDLKNYILLQDLPDDTPEKNNSFKLIGKESYQELQELFPNLYKSWIKEVMENDKNVFLRELLKGKKLA